MLYEINCFQEIYIACGKTDLRKGIDGLAAIVKEKFDLSPFQEDVLFLFCGTRQDRFKGLVWEGDGFVLLYKRIEAGRVKWPRNLSDLAQIDAEDFRQLLNGMTILEKSSIHKISCSDIA